jgi:asparagine synthase (glutamine-hydrolysing)
VPGALAGIFAPRGAPPEPAAAARALADGAHEVRTAVRGPLALATAGVETGGDTGPLCALDGHVAGLEELARRAGTPPGASGAVILAAAWVRLGDAALLALRGDWVAAIWDPASRRGVLARDPMGGRSLHLVEHAGRLLLASEVCELLRLLPRRPAPDPVAMAHWLAATDPRGGRTLYTGLRALQAGHLVELDPGGWRTRPFWTPVYAAPLRVGLEEAGELVRGALERAVDATLAGEEAAGVLLSGGLDSASVAGVASQEGPAGDARPALRAYSAVFPRHPSVDESALVDRLTTAYGLSGARIAVEGTSMLAGALHHLAAWELPLLSHNDVFWQPLLGHAREDGVTAVLDGEGGDLLFGPARELVADRLRAGRPAAAVELVRRLPGAGDHPPWPTVLRLTRDLGLRPALPRTAHAVGRRLRGPARHAPPWLTAASADLLARTHDPWAYKALAGPRWWRAHADALTAGLDALGARDHLRRRATTAGLHARQPLLDRALVELVLRLPPHLAFDPHHSRPVLRAAVAGAVPDSVRMRTGKSSFEALLHDSLTAWDLGAIHALLGRDGAEIHAYADRDSVREILLTGSPTRHPLGFRAWAYAVWRLATAELWLAHQHDPQAPARLLEGHRRGARMQMRPFSPCAAPAR